jgi:hypothetical protein
MERIQRGREDEWTRTSWLGAECVNGARPDLRGLDRSIEQGEHLVEPRRETRGKQ